MSTTHRVLFATDFSRCGEQAFLHALWWAEKLHGELELVHSIASELDHYDLDTLPVVDLAAQHQLARTAASEQLEALVERARQRGVTARCEVLEGGPVPQVLCDYAVAKKVELVVVGTHGRRGLGRLLLGSVAEQVVRKAPCPVFTVHETEHEPRAAAASIVAPVDFSEGARAGADWALALARRFAVPLTLVHVLDPALEAGLFMPGAYPLMVSNTGELKATAEQSLARLQDELTKGSEGGIAIERKVLYGSPPYEITDLARSLPGAWIVLATHSHTGLERLLLGSTAERVLRLAPCPVITLGKQAVETRTGLLAG